MRQYSANDLQSVCSILDSDAQTVLAESVRCGVRDLGGKVRLEMQLEAPATTHLVVMRFEDAAILKESGYLTINSTLYTVQTIADSFATGRAPRPDMFLEVSCHAERVN